MSHADNKSIIFWLFLFVLSVYCLVSSGHYGGDTINNYLTTESIVLDKSIRIDNRNLALPEIKTGEEWRLPEKERSKYSPFGIGMPLLQIPFFLKGLVISKIFKNMPQQYITFFSVSFTNSFLSAVNTALLYMIMTVLGFRKKRAVYLALIYSFSTMAIVYSKTGFVEPAMATFLLLSILSLFGYFAGRKKITLLIISGAALGFMGLIKNYSVMLAPLFIIYIFARKKPGKWAEAIAFTISFCAVFSLDLWLNYLRYGNILKSGYGDIAAVGLGYGHHFIKGLYYYWLSSGKGFFLYNIPLILSLVSSRTLFAKKRPEFWLIMSLIALYAFYFAYFFKRGSIFSWGPRYLFPIVPLFILLMDGVFDKKSLTVLLIILAIVGVVIQLPAVVMNYSKYIYFAKEKLGVEEYLINFVPDLSHINGCWKLFVSSLTRNICGIERIFTYSPDPVFIKPLNCPMSGYDTVDLWYINLARFNAGTIGLAAAAISMLCVSAAISVIMLLHSLRKITV